MLFRGPSLAPKLSAFSFQRFVHKVFNLHKRVLLELSYCEAEEIKKFQDKEKLFIFSIMKTFIQFLSLVQPKK